MNSEIYGNTLDNLGILLVYIADIQGYSGRIWENLGGSGMIWEIRGNSEAYSSDSPEGNGKLAGGFNHRSEYHPDI